MMNVESFYVNVWGKLVTWNYFCECEREFGKCVIIFSMCNQIYELENSKKIQMVIENFMWMWEKVVNMRSFRVCV